MAVEQLFCNYNGRSPLSPEALWFTSTNTRCNDNHFKSNISKIKNIMVDYNAGVPTPVPKL